MSSSRNRSGLFLPDERGIGGAMMIAQEYRHFFSSSSRSRPATDTHYAERPTAEQMSYQRANKRASGASSAPNHLAHRSAALLGVVSDQQQQWNRPQSLPPKLHRLRPCSITAGLCAWLPQTNVDVESRRPSSAPEQGSRRGQPSPSSKYHHQQDWQQLKAAARPSPQPPMEPTQLPTSRYYQGPNPLPSVQHRLFKSALMGDILSRQLYKAAAIRQLCIDFVRLGPPEHKRQLRQVAAEVLQELDIPFSNELDCAC